MTRLIINSSAARGERKTMTSPRFGFFPKRYGVTTM